MGLGVVEWIVVLALDAYPIENILVIIHEKSWNILSRYRGSRSYENIVAKWLLDHLFYSQISYTIATVS